MTDLTSEPLADFGRQVKRKFDTGLGEPEDHLRAPVERLIEVLAGHLHLEPSLAGEDHLADIRVRPDYAVQVHGALVGHIEVKAPGKGADPNRYRGHDRLQWERLRSLPNVLYTDGEQWGLYRFGEREGEIVVLSGPPAEQGGQLESDRGDIISLLASFLQWCPVAPRTVRQLALQSAQLCRLLRAEVLELLETDAGLQTLAQEWRELLFPEATDEQFADGYAQTVTFALLLARVDGVDFEDGDLGAIARRVSGHHTLIGTALGILTDARLTSKFAVSLPTLVRVLAVVDWPTISRGHDDRWLLFYEEFLQEYDPQLRRSTGSYYTPNEVVAAICRLVNDLLTEPARFGLELGLADERVTIVDPAAGTGTFLLEILRRMADLVEHDEGDAQVPPRLRSALQRVIGFERQVGPFSVAELRLSAELAQRGVAAGDALRLYVADTLDDPFVEEARLGAIYEPIARSRREANRIKADEPVLVVLGNPPYRERSKGLGGWVEQGHPGGGTDARAPMEDFFPRTGPPDAKQHDAAVGAGPHLKHLYNPYVYFWRWATWKVFDRHPDADTGIVAFITVAGFLAGPGFAFMRRYMRSRGDDIWVIDLSPEGHQPPVGTRVFSGVQQPVCICIVARGRRTQDDEPARVHYRQIAGSRQQKFDALAALDLNDDGWEAGGTGWTAPLLPEAAGVWASFAPLEGLLGWSGSGTMPGRTWVVAPDPDILAHRWHTLVSAGAAAKPELFQEHPTDRRVDTVLSDNLPGYPRTNRSIERESGAVPGVQRIGYRSFDRQWIIADKRVINRPNPTLWALRGERQVYLTTLTRHPVRSGPAVTCSALVPDLHHYRGSFGGRAWPMWADADASQPNLPEGLLDALVAVFGRALERDEVFAYVAGIAGHAEFTERFADELVVPGIRIPLTADIDVWDEVVALGRRTIWFESFGERMVDDAQGRPAGRRGIRLSEAERPRARRLGSPSDAVPAEMLYDPDAHELRFDDQFAIGPVSPEVVAFEVNGMNVLRKWFGYRKLEPEGRQTTGLSGIHRDVWPAEYTSELLDVLNVLGQLVALAPAHAAALDRVLTGRLIDWASIATDVRPAAQPSARWTDLGGQTVLT